MRYSAYGSIASVLLMAAIGISGAIGKMNWEPAKASITTIDRNCQIIETEYDGDYKRKSSRVYTDSCSSIDDWEKVRENHKKPVSGKAVVHLNYMAPQSGQALSGELNFTGRDEEFYALKAGDEIEILVSKSDPARIRKA